MKEILFLIYIIFNFISVFGKNRGTRTEKIMKNGVIATYNLETEDWYTGNKKSIKINKNKVKYIFEDYEIVNGLKNGNYKKYYENGSVMIKTTYKNEILDGLYEVFYETGIPAIKLTYKNGKKDGILENYYENGRIKDRTIYVDGLKNGIYEAFYPNGNIKEIGLYKNGKKDGTSKLYYGNKKIKERRKYKNGILVKMKRYQ